MKTKIIAMKLCVICGKNEATTRDHIPPKAIFPKPRPNNLITVPACRNCNNEASINDDLFKVYLSLQTSQNNELANKLFEEKTVKTLKRNQTLLNKIREEMTDIEICDEDGILHSKTGVLWNSEAHDEVIKRTIQGLYFHHTGLIAKQEVAIKVQWLRKIPDEILSSIELFNHVTIGDNQVVYKYIISIENPRHSLWIFDFYGAHLASGYTSPL